MTQFSRKIKLTNGLSVIFERNNNADIVSIQLGIKVGSVYESDDESGICHLIEHMVFKGSTSYKPGEIATLVESHGGELNAYTSLDQTVYFINLPSKHFNLGLKLIKEMVFDATIDSVELEREKEVVIEEIRRGEDNPQRVLGQTLFKTFYHTHNYRRPVIGTAKHVRSFNREKVINFYKKHYCPQNMILGVCGNIEENQLSQEIEELLRFQVNSPVTNNSIVPEIPKSQYKIATKKMGINATYFDLAFNAPQLAHKDVPALDILSHLLGESETSLLEQNTRDKQQLVHTIYSSCYTPKYPGLFMIGGLVDPKLLNKALFSIKEQVHLMQNQLMEDEKIERAKLLARSQIIYEQQTCEGTARKWITYETTCGDYNFDEKYIENINKISALDIQKAAQKYLEINKSTLIVLHPENIKINIDKSLFKRSTNHKKSPFKKQSQIKDAAIYKLDNGIRVILKENHRLPIVAMKTASLGGLRYETNLNNGINHLISNVVTRSTKNYSQINLAEKCEWLAGNLDGYTGRNSIGLSFSFLSEKLHQAIPLFSDVILNPAFSNKEVSSEKKLQLEAIKNRTDNPGQMVFRNVLEKLFHNHPYRYQLLGESKSVRKLSSGQLKNFYDKHITPKNFVISVVGDFESNRILDLLNEELRTFKIRNFSPKKIKKPVSPKNIQHIFAAKNKQQAHIALGFMGASLYDKDKYALEIINNILSGQGGRLFLELRDKQSLAYTVTSTMIEGMETGFFAAYIGTDPAKVNKSIDEIKKQLQNIQTEEVSSEELERAKNYIIGNHEIDNQRNSAIAMQFVLNEIYGKGLGEFYNFQKHITKVTKADIQRAAKKYINLNKYVIGVVGPKGCWQY